MLLAALTEAGTAVANFLPEALAGRAKVKMFGGEAVHRLAYLISHESHHRDQIMLVLKQAGLRQPEKLAVQGLWGKWIFGKARNSLPSV